MQNKRLIPTPLRSALKAQRAIEIVEPRSPSGWRFFKILLFLFGSLLRSIVARLWSPWAKVNYTPEKNALRLRLFMEEQGGLWVKAGQILALRRDIFEEPFCAELARLQDRALGFPVRYSIAIIEEDLGRPITELFDDFEAVPLAAASIGQTHRARLRGSGVELVIKVQRPNIAASFARDMSYLYRLVRILSRTGIAPNLRWEEMYWEIENAILEELDYRQEASSLKRMHKQLRRHKIYVPKVFLDLCSDRVLVMERVEGTYMSEFLHVWATDREQAQAWLTENNISARKAGERLLFSNYRQTMEDNFYHCDLHPGNILLMRDSHITLIDFGSVGSLDRSQLVKLLQMWISIGECDYPKVADMLLLLSPELPDRDYSAVKETIVRIYREFETMSKIKTLPYHQKSVGVVSSQATRALGEAGIGASWDLLRQVRAGLTLDASLMCLLPDIDYPKTVRRYIRKMRQRQRKKLQSPDTMRTLMAKVSEHADMPTKLAENAYFEGEYLRRRARAYAGYISKASQVGEYIFVTLSRACSVAAVLALAALVHQHYNFFERLRSTWVYEELERLPRFDSLVWMLAAATLVYVSTEMKAIKNILAQSEAPRTAGSLR